MVQTALLEAMRIRRNTASFLPAHRRNRIAALTRKARVIVQRLSAAGAPPAAAPAVPPGFADEPGWQELGQAASTQLVWDTDSHRLFPRAFKEAVRQLLLASNTGGLAAATTSCPAVPHDEGSGGGGAADRGQSTSGSQAPMHEGGPPGVGSRPGGTRHRPKKQERSSGAIMRWGSISSKDAVAGSLDEVPWLDDNVMVCIISKLAQPD